MPPDSQDDFWRGQNFLGRPSSLRLTGESPGDKGDGLAGALDAGTPTASVGPPGGGVGAPAGASGAATASAVSPGMSTMSPELRALLAGSGILEKGTSFAQPLLAGGAGEFGAVQTPSGQFTSGLPEILRDLQFPNGGLAGLTPAEYGLAATAEFGEAGAELGSELAGTVSGSWGGPIFAAMKSFIDLVGEGKVPFQDIIELMAPGTFGPSKEWLSFPSRLGKTLSTEADATNALAQSLLGAGSPQDVQAAIAAWRGAVGGAIPGFGEGAGPYDLPALPGAGGAGMTEHAHEPFNVDFAPAQAGISSLIQAALSGASVQDRIAAFQSGTQPLLDARAAKQAQRQAGYDEWLRTYDPGTGSA